jgi:hypothetical protein
VPVCVAVNDIEEEFDPFYRLFVKYILKEDVAGSYPAYSMVTYK